MITRFFAGIEPQEQEALFACLQARRASFPKGSYLFDAGEAGAPGGLVTAGELHIVKEDFWGNRSILSQIGTGGLFGEAFACAGKPPEVSALAARDTEVLFLNFSRLLSPCPKGCAFHSRLMRNFTEILAEKNVELTRKLELLARRSIRDKLLSYLSACAAQAGSNSFTIPFNRQQLADYLCVDRSALSAELGRLRHKIQFYKNHFTLIKEDGEGRP